MMKTYAHIAIGRVVNLSVADDDWQPPADAVDITNTTPQPGIGWAFSNGEFSAPTTPAVPSSAFVAHAEFMDRWTLEELAAFYTAKRTDPMLEAFEAAMDRVGGIRIGSDRANAGKAYLVQQSILTAERADELFAP